MIRTDAPGELVTAANNRTIEERAMIDYALRWVNSGGGPDTEITARFDMDGRTFYRCVLQILQTCSSLESDALGLSPVLATRIAAVARRRVWLSS